MSDFEDVTADIRDSGWDIVAWGADRHDSTEYAIHQKFADRDVLLNILVTPDNDVVHHVSEAWVYGGAQHSHAVLEEGHTADPPTAQRLAELFHHAMNGWLDAVEATDSAPADSASHGSNALVPVEADVLPIRRSETFGAGLPRNVQVVVHQLAVENIRQQAQIRLQEMGEELAAELAPIEEGRAAAQSEAERATRNRRADGIPKLLSTGTLPAKGLVAITFLAIFVMQASLASDIFRFVRSSTGGIPGEIGGLAGSIAYGGAVTLSASYVGFRVSQHRYLSAALLAVFSFVVLPLAISIEIGRSTFYLSATVLILSMVGAIATAVAAPLLSRRSLLTFGLVAADADSEYARLEAQRIGQLRIYVSRAEVVIAHATQQMISYVQEAVIVSGGEASTQLPVDWRPDCQWLDNALAELARYERKADKAAV